MAAESDASPAAVAQGPPNCDSDVSVRVVCGRVSGILLLPKQRIIVNPGCANAREVSPTEFERMGGRASAKKWRLSIKTANGAVCGVWDVIWGSPGSQHKHLLTA